MIVANQKNCLSEKVYIENFFALPNGDYYPFGKESRGSSSINEPKEQFTGKERDSESGLDYFGARYYNSEIARWLATDPMGKKYPSLSPYVYGANNPIVIIDIDGRDIIILSAPNAVAGAGHAAALIGNDKTGWYLYSKNGTTWSRSSGPANDNPQAGVPIKSLEEFATKYNTDENGEVEYTDAYQIETDAEADVQMMDAAAEVVSEAYDVTSTWSTNCVDVPSAALSAGGLNPGSNTPVPNDRVQTMKDNNKGTNATNKVTPNKQVVDQRKKEAEKRKAEEQEKKKQKEIERNGDKR